MIELDADNREKLKKITGKENNILNLNNHRNFLTFINTTNYDYVFTNPPFHLRKNENNLIDDVFDFDFIFRCYAMTKIGGHIHGIISGKWVDYRAGEDNNKLHNKQYIEMFEKIKSMTQFKALKQLVKFSNVSVSNTYFIHIRKTNGDLDDYIKNIKYYKFSKTTIGQSIENGEKSLKDLKEEPTEKINYIKAPVVQLNLKN